MHDAARLGADRAAKAFGAQHYVPVKGDDPDEQSALIDEALALRPDAFVLTPVHATRVNAAIADQCRPSSKNVPRQIAAAATTEVDSSLFWGDRTKALRKRNVLL